MPGARMNLGWSTGLLAGDTARRGTGARDRAGRNADTRWDSRSAHSTRRCPMTGGAAGARRDLQREAAALAISSKVSARFWKSESRTSPGSSGGAGTGVTSWSYRRRCDGQRDRAGRRDVRTSCHALRYECGCADAGAREVEKNLARSVEKAVSMRMPRPRSCHGLQSLERMRAPACRSMYFAARIS